jgi:hypothetical protein
MPGNLYRQFRKLISDISFFSVYSQCVILKCIRNLETKYTSFRWIPLMISEKQTLKVKEHQHRSEGHDINSTLFPLCSLNIGKIFNFHSFYYFVTVNQLYWSISNYGHCKTYNILVLNHYFLLWQVKLSQHKIRKEMPTKAENIDIKL